MRQGDRRCARTIEVTVKSDFAAAGALKNEWGKWCAGGGQDRDSY
jgi:hypothetical protein